MKAENIPHTVIDANCEGILFLLKGKYEWDDTWYKRAARKTEQHLHSLRTDRAYQNINRYKQTVKDLYRVLTASVRNEGIRITLSDYKHPGFSPVKSSDIRKAAGSPEANTFYRYFEQRLTSVIEQTGDDIVGISLFYLNQVLTAFAMIGFLRKRFPCIRIIAGGGLVNTWMKKPGFKNPFSGLVDEFVAGPGENIILCLYAKKRDGATHYTPSYSLFPLDSYLSPPYILPYAASRGCPWKKCAFCPEKAENNTYVPIPPSRVLQDINLISKQNKPVLLHLLDNAISTPLFNALTENPPGIPWYGYARITDVLADTDFCIKLKKAGCVMLQIGLESGDQEVLDAMNKGFTLDLASRVIRTLHRAGIVTYVYLLFGTPWETSISAQHTLEFCARHHHEIDFINPAIFNMPVCDPACTGYKTEGFYNEDLSLYTDFIHPEGWGRREVRQFLHDWFKKNKAITGILKATPPFFNANHAPFF
ncbi:MAG: radical SAM protein [Spirochaetales bacterium]|nr:radical SAM protein [Spirochaetales bacterium]